ncbi:MAG: lyase family protein, partial [Anaerolineae bacterium]
VGTGASYRELLAQASAASAASAASGADLEARVMAALNLDAFPVATQVYPRKQDWLVVNALAGLAGSLYKFAFDLRLLQSPPVGEWAEPFARKQVGSSAMPFKRNPINAENINSLARLVAALPRVVWDNAAHSLLERTLDDSANRREALPVAFLAVDEMLGRGARLIRDLQVNEAAVRRNLAAYGRFAATERLLMAAVAAGGDRQRLHEVIRRHSLAAWADVAGGRSASLVERLGRDPEITRWVPGDEVRALMDAAGYVGDAPAWARALAGEIRAAI